MLQSAAMPVSVKSSMIVRNMLKRWVRIGVVLCVIAYGAYAQDAQFRPEPEGTFVTVNGKRLWYRTEGQGPPLLLVPGGPGASHTYLWPHLSSLSKDFKVIYYDPYGRGQSDFADDPAEYTFARDVDEIEGLRRALQLPKINIYGHSYGAMVAQAYVLKYPGSVSHLIMVSPFHSGEAWQKGNNDTWNEQLQNQIPETWSRLQEMRSNGHMSCEEEYQRVQDEIPMTPSYYYDPSTRARSGSLDVNEEVYCRLAGPDADVVLGGEMAALDFRPKLREIEAPTLILASRWDRIAIPRFTTQYKDLMPQATFVMFEKSGHLPFIEEPDEHDTVVKEFLKIP
jgi:proline iminopeptidase